MADRSRPILDHEDQLDLLSRAPHTEQDDLVVVVKRVGRELRKARELKGAQLGDVSRAVNIHPNYLAAIEDGRFEDLPGRAFTIGYVARYARHLDVDVEHAVDRLQGKIALGAPVLDDDIDVTPLPDRKVRPAVVAIAVFVLAAVTYSAQDVVSFATGRYEQAATGQGSVDTPRPADEQTPVASAPPVPPPAGIAVTPRAALRADLTPAAIEQARIAAIPLPARIAVTPAASLRADLAPAVVAEQIRIARIPLPVRVAVTPPASLRPDLTPAAIRQQTRVVALLPMPLPAGVVVTSPASLRADLAPAVVAEQIRIARIPLPAMVAVTRPASLRADLTPAAIEEARIAAIPLEPRIAVTPPRPLRADLTPEALREQPRVMALFPMPLPAKIAVTLPATLPPDLDPAAIAAEMRIASTSLLTRASVSPRASPPAEDSESAQAQFSPGNRLGLRNSGSRITLRAHGPTFVAVRDARGRIFLERRLARGDSYRVPNQPNMRLTARDGGAVEVILDGDSLGFAGSRGLQTNELALNPQTIADRLKRF
jgi:cytoskeleton protein RodZ